MVDRVCFFNNSSGIGIIIGYLISYIVLMRIIIHWIENRRSLICFQERSGAMECMLEAVETKGIEVLNVL